MTSTILDWVHHCLLREVWAYLENKGFPFKLLLVLDNTPSHPHSLRVMFEDVEIVFLPPNTISLIHPRGQGIIKNIKAWYTSESVLKMHTALSDDPNLKVIDYWNSFTIADCLTIISETMKKLSPKP